MNRFLSQLHTVPADFFLYWVIVALVFLGVVVAAVTLWSNLRQRPPHEVPTRREFDSLASKVSHIELGLPVMERRILEAIKDSTEKTAALVANVEDKAREGREKIWSDMHKHTDRISTLEAKQKP